MWENAKEKIISLSKLLGALAIISGVVVSIWAGVGADRPAWSGDLQKLNKRQADTAVDFYSRAIRDDTILRAQISDTVTKALIDERLREAKEKRDEARERSIELSK